MVSLVARTRNPARRQELERQALSFLLDHGVQQLTLRSLAAALGVSTYALVYHFGSKEQLLEALLERFEREVAELLEGWLQPGDVGSGGEVVRRYWRWFVGSPTARRQTQLRLEIWSLALRKPDRFQRLRARNDPTGQVEFIARVITSAGVNAEGARAAAMLISSALLGLQVQVVARDQQADIQGGVDLLAQAIDLGLITG